MGSLVYCMVLEESGRYNTSIMLSRASTSSLDTSFLYHLLFPAWQKWLSTSSGCTSTVMIGLLLSDQIKRVCKRINDTIPLSALQEQLILALRFWVVNKQRIQQHIDPESFTMILALNQAQLMHQQLEDKARGEGEALARAPNKFKPAANGKVFAEAMDTHLSQLLGSGRIPLKYVIHTQAMPDPNAIYATTQAQLIALAPLNGDSFNHDNARVYGLIKQLVL